MRSLVMFCVLCRRMFVDALDKRFFNEHYLKGVCMLASNSVEVRGSQGLVYCT